MLLRVPIGLSRIDRTGVHGSEGIFLARHRGFKGFVTNHVGVPLLLEVAEMPPQTAIARVAAKAPAMMKPTVLTLKLAKKLKNGSLKLTSCPIRPTNSIVTMKRATNTQRPVMFTL